MTSQAHPNPPKSDAFFWLARQPSVVRRAAKISLIVGCILAAINHWDAVMQGHLGLTNLIQIILTFLVPYSVSTYSSVMAIRERTQLLAAQTSTAG